MTFREYILERIGDEIEFDAIIGNVDMPGTFCFVDNMSLTPYCEEKFGALLDSDIEIIKHPYQLDTVEVFYNDDRKGRSFFYASAGYIAESEYNKLFFNDDI